jgi:hypothetical protein
MMGWALAGVPSARTMAAPDKARAYERNIVFTCRESIVDDELRRQQLARLKDAGVGITFQYDGKIYSCLALELQRFSRLASRARSNRLDRMLGSDIGRTGC